MSGLGKVYLIGAGPGDPGLLTLRARDLLTQADVIVYDYLCNPVLLDYARADAEKLFAGKMSGRPSIKQEDTNQLLIDLARAGKTVARLKGGDPYIFGRGGEEGEALFDAGIRFEVVPGVSSISSVPAYAGIPITHRDYCSSFMVVTGHLDPRKDSLLLDYEQLAQFKGTRVLLMGISKLAEITAGIIASGGNPATPCAVIQWGTHPRQRSVSGPLAEIAQRVKASGITAPAITLIGEVIALREKLNWFEQRPLFGKRIAVTRSAAQAGRLATQLTALGADVLLLPLLRITPPQDTAALQKAARDVAQQDWVVFTSANAVRSFFEQFFQQHRDLRALGAVRFAAVGTETASAINALHLTVDLTSPRGTSESLAEAFLALGAEALQGKQMLFLRGDIATRTLPDALQKAGVLMTEVEAYRNEPETADPAEARERIECEGVDFVTFTSASTVDRWHAAQVKSATPWRAVSIGPSTSKRLRDLGYTEILEAPQTTLPSLIETVLQASC